MRNWKIHSHYEPSSYSGKHHGSVGSHSFFLRDASVKIWVRERWMQWTWMGETVFAFRVRGEDVRGEHGYMTSSISDSHIAASAAGDSFGKSTSFAQLFLLCLDHMFFYSALPLRPHVFILDFSVPAHTMFFSQSALPLMLTPHVFLQFLRGTCFCPQFFLSDHMFFYLTLPLIPQVFLLAFVCSNCMFFHRVSAALMKWLQELLRCIVQDAYGYVSYAYLTSNLFSFWRWLWEGRHG